MLLVENLIKQFDAVAGEPAGGVFDVSFEIAPGEFFTLLGPSGCGKTTTLRCVAGLEYPDSGRIVLAGAELFSSAAGVGVPSYDRDIGMVFQSYAIWPHMSVFENAAYPLRVSNRARIGRDEITRRVDRILEIAGLIQYRNRSATQLSGGQQQRLALARALVREPKLLLLDEPLSNLDAKLREQMRSELKRIQRETGVTSIYVTHDQSEAMSLSDRVAVLDQGRIVQVGTPEQIYELPRNEFVANFIGRTNLFRGRVEQAVSAGGLAPVSSEIGTVRCRFSAAMAAGQELSFIVRPENVELVRNGGGRALPPSEPSCGNLLEGRVTGRTYLGEIAEYTVNLAGSRCLIARARPDLGIGLGDSVTVRLPAERVIAICE
jgi:iron(III) transport system ATP-binding protein